MGGFTKQDARTSRLNLDLYSVDDMLADLGNHRHTELPLSGRRLTKDPPPPDSAKLGRRLVKLAQDNTGLQSAWNTLYNPSMDENRSDGLGTGQTHRTGANFRPNQNAIAGRGIGVSRRRTRSHSPKRANRGRGGSILGISMGIRPAKLPNTHKPPLGPKDSPSIRHIRPRVTIKAADDSAVGPTRRPNPVGGQGNQQVAHWYVGRLTVNNDHSDFFSPSRKAGIAEPVKGTPVRQKAVKKVVPTAPAAMRISPLSKTPAPPRPKPAQLALSGLRMVQSSLNQVQGGLAVSKHAPKLTDNRNVNASVKNVPPRAGEWVVPPPPARFEDLPSPFEHASLPPPPQELMEELQKVNAELAVRLPSNSKDAEGGPGLTGPSSNSKTEEAPLAVLDTKRLPIGVTTAHKQTVSLSVAKTADQLKTEIKDLDEELASATVLMEVYKVKLDEVTKQENDILLKLEGIRRGKQDIIFRHDSQSDKMQSIKIQLAALREEYHNLCAAEREPVKEDLIEKQDVERKGREKEQQKQENLKRQVLETEILKKQQEYLRREQARIADALKLHEEEDIRREKEYHEANEQRLEASRQADNVRIEKERIDKERLGVEQHDTKHFNGSGLDVSIHAPHTSAIKIETPDTLSDKKDQTSDSAAFKAHNPIVPGTAIPQGTDLFPFKIKVVLRPIFDKDPVELSLTHTDQAAQKLRRTLGDILNADDFKYLCDLPDYNAYVDDVNKKFFARMGRIYGGRQ